MTTRTKTCTGCGQAKPTTAQAYCRPCKRAYNAAYREQNREAMRERERRRPPKTRAQRRRANVVKYGISVEDYEMLYDRQQGMCAICFSPRDTLFIDHDHKTGQVRGLLCGNCNTALGMLRDSVGILKLAISYLEDASASYDGGDQ